MHFQLHSESSKKKYGEAYLEVHEFLDQYSEKFEGEHRKVYHHRKGIQIVKDKFGAEAVKIAEEHIKEDLGMVPENHEYFKSDNAELNKLAEEIYKTVK